jgi:tetratricopeptide (TPR) repeat protein
MSVPSTEIGSRSATTSAAINSLFDRRVFLFLGGVALVYALLAGLRTAADLDLGWQLASGRWVVQHHSVPSVDVLSYTAAGRPWIYPVGGEVIFYLAYLVGGYGLLSWLGAAACVGTIALLLRRGSAVTAALAILAVPLIALRTTPRADMFTVVLFAAFFSLLWEHYQTGRARLWLLPLLMVTWVNLHLGFIAGLGLLIAYAVAELLQATVSGKQRPMALRRSQDAATWLGMTVLATLVNPWGWGIYRAILLQRRVSAQHDFLIMEWLPVPLNWTALIRSFSLRDTTRSSIYVLLAIALIAAMLALWRAELGAALLLLAAAYEAVQHGRMGALFACVVVVVGGPILADAVAHSGARIPRQRARWALAWTAVALLVLLSGCRSYDLVTNRFYFRSTSSATFGAGLGWWFPQRAAEFIQKASLPGEVFNTYDEGGYVAWKLGPARRDTIDGRAIPFGVVQMERNNQLLKSSPDSALWQEETGRYSINTILLPLGRFHGIELVQLQAFCSSTLWQVVYLDEVSAVLVRRTPQTEELRRRLAVNCATAPLPRQAPSGNGAEAFNAWSNAAALLSALGRNSEGLTAIDHALDLFPGSAFAHWLRGNLLSKLGRPEESGEEYLLSASLEPNDLTWAALAQYYGDGGWTSEAIADMRRAVALSPQPYPLLVNLGYLYLKTGQPEAALRTFNRAESNAPRDVRAADNGTFDFMVTQGRSVAWDEMGDLPRAIALEEQAIQFKPDAPEPWQRLAKLYRRAGRVEDAIRAEQRAAAETKPSAPLVASPQ